MPSQHQRQSISETSPLLLHHGGRKMSQIAYELFDSPKNNSAQKGKSSPKPVKEESIIDKDNTVPESNKLGTIGGVFLPTVLNVLSILMFLRFGFIIGQMGILGTFLLLILSYIINLLTTLSISAIATNGTVKGGGAYYMISRSLGVEFGGAIGIIFYIGQVLNSSLNAAGFIEPLLFNFNDETGVTSKILPTGYWFQFAYSSSFLAVCTGVSLVGAGTVSKAGSFLVFLLLIATLSIPVSAFLVKPFEVPEIDSYYSGICWATFKENLLPHFTAGAVGSAIKGVETFNDLFGIFFPATAGIFAGASMSGDLISPSKSIPKGTLGGLLLTFICYALVIISMGSSIPKDFLHKDIQVIQSVSISGITILLGELSSALFSVIVGIVGAAKVLQAIARDEILPGLKIFGIGTKKADDPIYGIILTWVLAQAFLLADINQIATLITMAFLMTFIVTNLACFLLKLGSAPNFRPSFKYFSQSTALLGTLSSGIAMFIVDGISASLIFVFLMFLIIFIHYVSPPKQWGDVSQSLIYHQVRKYLLKLKQDNVKYWRPQILLLIDNPRTAWRLINFCNHLKKGGLYVLGHVLVSDKFQGRLPEIEKQRSAWIQLRDMSKIKAFVQIAIAPTFTWGARNIFLSSGLGGMKPNITVLGFYDLANYEESSNCGSRNQAESRKPGFANQINIIDKLPTDSCATESKITVSEWVQTLEDLSLLGSNIAVAKGFPRLLIPTDVEPSLDEGEKKYIDLYPIQMSAQVIDDLGTKTALTTNFDTYTLILQLGAILNTVPQWKKTHKIRVVVFVEFEDDVDVESTRVQALLEVLRINAEVVVLALNSGNYPTYDYITNGSDVDSSIKDNVNTILKDDEWWTTLTEFRTEEEITQKSKLAAISAQLVDPRLVNKLSRSHKRRYTVSNMNRLGVSLSMRTNRILNSDITRTMGESSDTESDMLSDDESILSVSSKASSRRNSVMNMKQAGSSPLLTPQASIPNLTSARRPLYYSQASTNSIHDSPLLSSNTQLQPTQQPKKMQRMLTRSMFSADTVPKSQIFENAVGDQPSIMFVNDPDKESTRDRTGSRASSIRKLEHQRGSSSKDSSSVNLVSSKRSAATNTPTAPISFGNPFPANTSLTNIPEPDLEETENDANEVDDSLNFSFDEITTRAQYLILNEVMKKQSAASQTAIIFSTLPLPDIGTHRSESDSLSYVTDLEYWCEDLPPILLINAKTMTVTTAL